MPLIPVGMGFVVLGQVTRERAPNLEVVARDLGALQHGGRHEEAPSLDVEGHASLRPLPYDGRRSHAARIQTGRSSTVSTR